MNVYRTRLNDLQENIVTLILDLIEQTTALIEEFLNNILGMSIFELSQSCEFHASSRVCIDNRLLFKTRQNNLGFSFIKA
jgi:hypothetical protein